MGLPADDLDKGVDGKAHNQRRRGTARAVAPAEALAPVEDPAPPADTGCVADVAPVTHKSPLRASDRVRRIARSPRWRAVATCAIAAVVVLAAVVTTSMDQLNTALVIMGFDPDRAQLITSLILGGVATCAAMLVTGRFGLATAAGFAGAALLYVGTFGSETQGAMAANGTTGAFDLGGWVMTLLALLVIGVVAAWAGAALAAAARPWTVSAARVCADAITQRRVERSALRYPLAVVVVVALLVVTIPTFGQLVNYAPDSLMRGGAGEAVPGDVNEPGITPEPSAQASGPASAASPSPVPSALGSQPPRPWLAWKPSGTGHAYTFKFAAPWKGGTADFVNVTIYTPPAYDSAAPRRYPVLYEAPTGYVLWNSATNTRTALDTLIDSGAIPAMIMVFIDSAGGPYPNTQCIDSYDHKQWFDRFVSQTVVGWVDSHYKTIADARARAIAGMSEGGYCAANLALRHPNTFGTSISFSGYFQAGGSGDSSAAPFGGNVSLRSANSPTLVAAKLDVATRDHLFFVVIAKPNQPNFGPAAAEFDKILSAGGYPMDAVAANEPHGWPQVRDYLPGALESWAQREIATGIF